MNAKAFYTNDSSRVRHIHQQRDELLTCSRRQGRHVPYILFSEPLIFKFSILISYFLEIAKKKKVFQLTFAIIIFHIESFPNSSTGLDAHRSR